MCPNAHTASLASLYPNPAAIKFECTPIMGRLSGCLVGPAGQWQYFFCLPTPPLLYDISNDPNS